jgi:hypothetical protein
MRTLQTILAILFSLSLAGQTTETKTSSAKDKKDIDRQFKNQGEQEDYWATQFLEKNYSKQNYPKYTEKIVVDGNIYKYGDMNLRVENTNIVLKTIFAKGIFYPTIITGIPKNESKTKHQVDTLTPKDIFFQNFNRPGSMTISGLEELPFFSISPQTKRFRFLLYRKGLLNPTVYFIELTNNNATDSTDLITFISDAVLTFFKEGWLMI